MKQAKQNYARIMKYDSGELTDYGISAEAEIKTSCFANSWLINRIHSGGLWGINSDCSIADFEEVENEQVDDLKNVLLELGFSKAEIKKAPIENQRP